MKQSLLIFLHFFDKPITNYKLVIKFLLSVSYFFNLWFLCLVRLLAGCEAEAFIFCFCFAACKKAYQA